MTTLFPTFTSIWQRAKRLLAKDIKSVLELLGESEESATDGFHDGFLYHPPIT
jgi:hypothetical protein